MLRRSLFLQLILLSVVAVAAVAQTNPSAGVSTRQADDTRWLEAKIAAYRKALQENTRERVPLEWAMTRMNLGNALRILGGRESGTAQLEETVSAFREALQERTRARVPLQWAMTQQNLAVVYGALYSKDNLLSHLDPALESVDGALEEYRKANAAYYIEKAEGLRRKILAAKANRTPPRPPVTK